MLLRSVLVPPYHSQRVPRSEHACRKPRARHQRDCGSFVAPRHQSSLPTRFKVMAANSEARAFRPRPWKGLDSRGVEPRRTPRRSHRAHVRQEHFAAEKDAQIRIISPACHYAHWRCATSAETHGFRDASQSFFFTRMPLYTPRRGWSRPFLADRKTCERRTRGCFHCTSVPCSAFACSTMAHRETR